VGVLEDGLGGACVCASKNYVRMHIRRKSNIIAGEKERVRTKELRERDREEGNIWQK